MHMNSEFETQNENLHNLHLSTGWGDSQPDRITHPSNFVHLEEANYCCYSLYIDMIIYIIIVKGDCSMSMRPADSKVGRTKGGLATFREHGGKFIIMAHGQPPLKFKTLGLRSLQRTWIGSRAQMALRPRTPRSWCSRPSAWYVHVPTRH